MSQNTVSTIFFTVPRTFFSSESQCVSTTWTVFFTQAHSGKPMFRLFIKIFGLKYVSPYISLILLQILYNYIICTSQPPKIWWQTSVQAWSILFDLPSLQIATKQLFLWNEYIILVINQFQTMSSLDLWKKFWKKYTMLLSKNSPYLSNESLFLHSLKHGLFFLLSRPLTLFLLPYSCLLQLNYKALHDHPPCRLRLSNTLTAHRQRGKTPPTQRGSWVWH